MALSVEDVGELTTTTDNEWPETRPVMVTVKNYAGYVFYVSTDKALTVEKLNAETAPEQTFLMAYDAVEEGAELPESIGATANVDHYGDYYLYAVTQDAEGKALNVEGFEKHIVVANVGTKPVVTVSGSNFFMTANTVVSVSCDNADFTDFYYSFNGQDRVKIQDGQFTVSQNGTYTVFAVEPGTGSEVASDAQEFVYIKNEIRDLIDEYMPVNELTATPNPVYVGSNSDLTYTVSSDLKQSTGLFTWDKYLFTTEPVERAEGQSFYEAVSTVEGAQEANTFSAENIQEDVTYYAYAMDSQHKVCLMQSIALTTLAAPVVNNVQATRYVGTDKTKEAGSNSWANCAEIVADVTVDDADSVTVQLTIGDRAADMVQREDGKYTYTIQPGDPLCKEGSGTYYVGTVSAAGASEKTAVALSKMDYTKPTNTSTPSSHRDGSAKKGYYYTTRIKADDNSSGIESVYVVSKDGTETVQMRHVEVEVDFLSIHYDYWVTDKDTKLTKEPDYFLIRDKAGNEEIVYMSKPPQDMGGSGIQPTVTLTLAEGVDNDNWSQSKNVVIRVDPSKGGTITEVELRNAEGDAVKSFDSSDMEAARKTATVEEKEVVYYELEYSLPVSAESATYTAWANEEAYVDFFQREGQGESQPLTVNKIDSKSPVFSDLQPFDANGKFYAGSKVSEENPKEITIKVSDTVDGVKGSGIDIKNVTQAPGTGSYAPDDDQGGTFTLKHIDPNTQTYTITAKDNVDRESTETVTVYYDGNAPVVNEVSLTSGKTGNDVFYYTSATYCKTGLTLSAQVQDPGKNEEDTSGVQSVWVTYNTVDEEGNVTNQTLNPNEEGNFVFENGTYDNVTVHVMDYAGNEGTFKLTKVAEHNDIKSDRIVVIPNGNLHLTAGINNTNNDDVTSYYNAESGKWFYGDTVIGFDFSVKDSAVGLYHAVLTLTGKDTNEALFDKVFDSDQPNQARVDTAPSGKEDIKTVETKNYDDGLYTVSASAENNIGESDLIVDGGCAEDISFIIDKTNPAVDAVSFKPLSEASAIEDGVQDPAVDIVPTNYGFFFKEGAEVTVYASDVFAENNAFASGVASITYRLVDRAGNEVKTENLPADGNGEITFTVDPNFKGQIYLTAYDNVGNKSAEKQLRMWMIVEDAAKHAEPETSSAMINMPVAFGTTDAEWGTLPLYNGAINPTIQLVGTFSGIDLERTVITVSHTPLGSTNTETQTYKGNDPKLTQSNVVMDANIVTGVTLTLPISDIESNHIEIAVEMHDNAGNTNKAENAVFAIDKSVPVIDVQFDNNAAENAKYFKADRTATITVTDWNFDPAKFTLSSENGLNGAWQHANGTNVWTNSVSYTTDGDYTFNATCTDRAGWTDEGVRYAEGTAAPTEFTVDKTTPVISYSFDNMNVRNGKYFNAGRTATIVINEHNFSYTVEGYSPVVTMTAGIAEGATAVPGVNGWSMGSDKHSATVSFSRDGDYTMKIDYRDLAGNVAEQVSAPDFTIDTTAPTLTITGVEDHHAYKGEVAPSIVYHDINYDPNSPGISITGVKHPNVSNMNGVTSNDAFGGSFTAANIQVLKANDDVYTIVGTITDLAGNTTEQTLTFSVNRFGSTYAFDQQTEQLLNNYYSNAPQDVVIREINVDRVVSHSIVASVNGESRTLVEGEDYTVTESGNGWMEYVYTIKASVFDKEGPYDIIVTSEDEAGNVNTNRTVKADGGVVEGVPVNFVLDETAPNILFDNVQNRHRYIASSRDIYVRYDDNVAVATVEVFNNDELVARYEGEDLAEFDNGEIPMTVTASNEWQNMVAVAYDAAGNQSGEAQVRFLLTSNIFVQFINSLWAILIALAVIALIIFFIIKRRRDDDDEQQQQTA